MPSYVLRPDSAVYPAAADDSDSTFFSLSPSQTLLLNFFDTVTLAAGERISGARLRIRARGDGDIARAWVTARFASAPFLGETIPFLTTSFAAYSGATAALNATQSDLNALEVSILAVGASSPPVGVDLAEAYVDVYTALQPTAAITYPTGSPTITDTTSPTVTWTHTPGTDGGLQSRYQVNVFTAAQYGVSGFNPATSPAAFTSGIVLSNLATLTAGPFTDGPHRVYVRTAQTINGQAHWSDWDFEAFTIDVATPVIDAVTVVPDDTNGRIRVTVELDTAGVDWDYLSVERTDDGGTTWVPVRGATRTDPPDDAWVGYDYEAPPDTVVRYRARPITVDGGLDAVGDWVTSSTTQWTTELIWLKALYSTALTRTYDCLIDERPQFEYPKQQGISEVLSSSAPSVSSDVLGLRRGSFTIETNTAQERLDLLALLDESVLLIQFPTGLDVPSMYATTGTPVETRPYVVSAVSYWTIPVIEQLLPFDDGSEVLTTGLTWDDEPDGATWDDLDDVETWADVA